MDVNMVSENSGGLHKRVQYFYADNEGVKIHYVSLGEGPLVVMIHGFPDFWYSWRHQMETLEDQFRVVAIDLRGYNRSDRPKGLEAYKITNLVEDVAAVIKDCRREKATIVGHDWGGVIAWQFALRKPEITEKLIVLNLPHPKGIARELANNPEQQKNSDYARKFIQGSHTDPEIFFGQPMTAENLALWVKDEDVKALYIKAFERSDFEAMLNYYKQNYMPPKKSANESSTRPALPKIKMPVLQFHGLKDKALHSDGLNNTWDWLEKDLTLVTIPDADHFVQQDAAELVSSTMRNWLLARP
jgi:pimeloyl-ACP methyl ester carboxylesterase